jgi:hypothetical protein
MADYTQSLPGIGAYWAGQRERQDQEQNQAKLMELQQALKIKEQEAAFSQQSNPLKLEEMSLRNQGLQAGLPGIMADVEGKQLGVAKTKATQDSSIEATNAENIFKTDATKAKKVGAMAEAFTQFGPLLKQLPDAPGARANVLRTLMGQSGYSLDTPEGQAFAKILESTPSAQLPDTLISMGEQLIKMTGPYIQATSVANINKDAQKEIAADNRAAQIQMNNDQINAGKYAKKDQDRSFEQEVEGAVNKAKTARDKHATLVRASVVAEQGGNTSLAFKYKQQAEAIRPQAEAEINTRAPGADLGALGVKTTTPPSIAPPGAKPQAPATGRITVVSPDGKRGSIPADQLEQAMKQGYKKVQ